MIVVAPAVIANNTPTAPLTNRLAECLIFAL
jgi:hypothetical protein